MANWFDEIDNFPIICWVSNNVITPKEKKIIRLITSYNKTLYDHPIFIGDETFFDKEGWLFATRLSIDDKMIYGG